MVTDFNKVKELIADAPSDGQTLCESALKDWGDFVEKENSFCILDNAFFQYPTNALITLEIK